MNDLDDPAEEAEAQRFAKEADALLAYLEVRGLSEQEACIVMRVALSALEIERGEHE